ncbi:MAG: adenylate/guanylate cyclase domain-containing protein [Bacteroidota bacterium]
MECPKCRHDNPESAKFCNECGNNLTHFSIHAPKELSNDEKIEKIKKYLPKGLTDKILSQRDKIEGERKQVTVMFCDMEGFTPLVEKLGPEKTYSIMDEVYEILIHKVHEYEGIVNEMTGDGVMALFGAPIALEDAPQRAIRSAYAIHREMNRFNDKIKQTKKDIPTLKMRIGINTGPVVVGALGNNLRVEFKAVGDTVNLASRMEGIADPGTTFVAENTYKLTEGLFRFKALGRRQVKGKADPINIYKALLAKEDLYRPRLGFERMIYSELVGRDREIDRLELQVMKAINGEGSIVNIIGEAGIGKSRLVAEMKTRYVMKRISLLEGRAISIGRNLNFHPIIDLLKQWAQISEKDSEASAVSKVESCIRRVYPEGVGEVLPFVGVLMGMKLSGRYAERVKGIKGEALEKLIVKSVYDLLIKATELSPLVIVIEDLHWADTSSIELLSSLFRLVESRKILFINVFRPNHKETGDKIVETIKQRYFVQYTEIMVEPLDERMSENLINNMLKIKGLQHATMDQIVQRSSGNPFFIEEVVRSLIDEGAVVKKDASFEVTEKIDTMIIPHTLNDVLMVRIDRLEEKTRNLVKIASVIGRSFFYRILTEVAKTIKDIDKRLSYLKEIQLIRERMKMDEIEYLFKHALAQEAAYESILLQKRKRIHLKVAESIEKIFRQRLHEFYGMLAFHYSRGEDDEKAEEYLLKAGEEALKSSASIEALHYYQEALETYIRRRGDIADPEKIAGLEKNIAQALFNRGQYVEAIESFSRVQRFYGMKEFKPSALGVVKFCFGFLYFLTFLYLPFLRWKRIPSTRDIEIFDLINQKGQSLAVTDAKRFFFELGFQLKHYIKFDLTKIKEGYDNFGAYSPVFSWSGISFMLSRKILHVAKPKLDSNNARSVLAYKLFQLMHNIFSGDWETSEEYNDEMVNQNLKIGNIFFASAYVTWSGLVENERGRHSEVKRLRKRQIQIGKEYDHEFSIVCGYHLNGMTLLKFRKFQDKLNEVDEGINYTIKTGFNLYLLAQYTFKARMQILMEDIQAADRSLQKAKEIIDEVDTFPYYLSFFFVCRFARDLYLLEQSINTGNFKKYSKKNKVVLRSGKKAVRISRKVAFERIETYKLMGLYYWLMDRQKKACRWWHRSIHEGERLGARLELSRTYSEVGRRMIEPKSKFRELDGIKAEEYLEKAKEMFEEMDLQWDLDELDRIVTYR